MIADSTTLPALRPPPHQPRRVPALHGLLWLQQGFRLFTAQPGRWALVLILWLCLWLLLPSLLALSLEYLRRVIMIAIQPLGLDESLGDILAILPALAGLAMILLFPLVQAGLMLGCAAVSRSEALRPTFLFAALEREPSRFVTVGGINAVGQILMSAAMGWLIHDQLGDIEQPDGTISPQRLVALMPQILALAPSALPVVVLQIMLLAVLWFTPPLLACHEMSALEAVKASLQACARNFGALAVYALGITIIVSFTAAIGVSMKEGILFWVPALLVLFAALTTLLGSIYVAYRDIFDVQA